MARYLLKSPHYLDGVYVFASPETPTIIDFDDTRRKPSPSWIKVDDVDGRLEKLRAEAPAVQPSPENVAPPPAPAPAAVATPPVVRKGTRKNDDDLLP